MEIEDRIRQILHHDLFVDAQPEEIGVDDNLREVHNLDSLGFLELRMKSEDLYGVEISDADYRPENFSTVRAVAAMIRGLQARVPA